jgi:hypothetical protein
MPIALCLTLAVSWTVRAEITIATHPNVPAIANGVTVRPDMRGEAKGSYFAGEVARCERAAFMADSRESHAGCPSVKFSGCTFSHDHFSVRLRCKMAPSLLLSPRKALRSSGSRPPVEGGERLHFAGRELFGSRAHLLIDIVLSAALGEGS